MKFALCLSIVVSIFFLLGQPNADANRIVEKHLGFSFETPADWSPQRSPETDSYLFGSNTIPGLMILTGHTYQTLQQMVAGSQQGIVDGGLQLFPTSQVIQLTQSSVGADFGGTADGVPAKAYVVGVMAPNGGGLLCISVTTTEKFSPVHRESVLGLARSIQFFEPEIDHALVAFLAGGYFSFTGATLMYSSGGTERKLCLQPDGTFYSNAESGYSGFQENQYGEQTMNWGSHGGNRNAGRWRPVGNRQRGTLILTYPNGNTAEMAYEVGNPQTGLFYFDGIKYGRVPEGCR